MPREMDGEFFGSQFGVIYLDVVTLERLKDYFFKLLPDDAPGDQGEKMRPSYMKLYFEKSGLDTENPSIYAMICWMTTAAAEEPVVDGISFEEFIAQAVYFFSQSHS